MISDIGLGTGYLAKGFSLIKDKRVRPFVLIPLLLNITLFGGLLWFGFSLFDPLVNKLMSYLPSWLNFLETFVWLLFTSMTAVIVFFTFTPIANIISAPFNAIMSEKIEAMLTGIPVKTNVDLLTLIKDSVLSQLRKLVYILLWSLGLFLVSVIPVINIISPVLWVVFGAWLLTLEYMDYPMGNHNLTFKQQKQKLKQRRGLTLGFGGMVMILTTIPIVNFIVIPVAVAGATAMWVDQYSDSSNTAKSLV